MQIFSLWPTPWFRPSYLNIIALLLHYIGGSAVVTKLANFYLQISVHLWWCSSTKMEQPQIRNTTPKAYKQGNTQGKLIKPLPNNRYFAKFSSLALPVLKKIDYLFSLSLPIHQWPTISFIILWHSSMFYQIFLSPQAKRWAIITDKHGINELPNDLRVRILGN